MKSLNIKDYNDNIPSVITVGTFDGIHLGHRKLIEKVLDISESENLRSIVLTFDPHPRVVLNNDNNISLGMGRLSIIDLKSKNLCPFQNEKIVLSFNGEIYNYLELRDELQRHGVVFKTDSDTEVLLGMLMRYGEKALTKLNGMYAFVFHDRKQNQWIVARDPFGIKPLYYIQVGDQLIFASEIKAILAHPDVPARRNDKALHLSLIHISEPTRR